MSGDQGLASQAHSLQIVLFRPLTCEPNTILWVIPNCVPTIGAVCGKACALAQVVAESSLYQTRVWESSSISSNTLLLSRHKFPLGATPRSVNGTGSSKSFQYQANVSHLGRGANPRKKNDITEKLQVLDKTNTLYGLRT